MNDTIKDIEQIYRKIFKRFERLHISILLILCNSDALGQTVSYYITPRRPTVVNSLLLLFFLFLFFLLLQSHFQRMLDLPVVDFAVFTRTDVIQRIITLQSDIMT